MMNADDDSPEQVREDSELQEILLYQKALQDVTNLINSAPDVNQLVTSTRQAISSLFSVEHFRIYIFDKRKNQLYSALNPSIKIPVDNNSIPGFVAKSGMMVNIGDAYDAEELKEIDEELKHSSDMDAKYGFRTREVMATAASYEEELMAVIEVANKKEKPGKFIDEEPVLLQEIADTLGTVLSNLQKKKSRTKFDYLVENNLLKKSDLDNSWGKAGEAKMSIEEYLLKTFGITREDMAKSFELYHQCEFVPFSENYPVPHELLAGLRQEFLRRELWVPLKLTDSGPLVLVDDPSNILKKDQILNYMRTKKVVLAVSLKEDILKFINMFFKKVEDTGSVSDILGKLDGAVEEAEEDEEGFSESDSTIMQLVNKIINDAYASRASDIHIEPSIKRKNVGVRFRIDGSCVNYQTLPYSYRSATVSRIKIMANLDITERRLPQDGKIKFRKGDTNIELRVATIPTQGSMEDIVMRILAQGEAMGLEQMSMTPENLANLKKILDKPYGIILVVGPTGSGKTTTLHAALQYLNTPDNKIWTAEDPVEITQSGLRQVQVNSKIGFDFSHAMRAFLRADPDIIMVGEMRDFETAKIGVEASLTGHLVLSTLHTNSAPETIIRLLDMGIDPFNFADSLLGVLAQRLVRSLCKKCREAYEPEPAFIEEIREIYGPEFFAEAGAEIKTLYRPKGCSECNNSGYKGRIGIHELLVTNDAIKKLVAGRAMVENLRTAAIENGMRTLLQDGIRKVVAGLTDLNQILAVCMR